MTTEKEHREIANKYFKRCRELEKTIKELKAKHELEISKLEVERDKAFMNGSADGRAKAERLHQKAKHEKDMIFITEVLGVQLSRVRELFDLFMESGFNIRDDKDWEEIKRKFFKKGEK